MNSMTGYGRAEVSRKEYRLCVELSSVNGRYLECIFRMPRTLIGLEAKIRELIGKNISRGKVTVIINLEESPVVAAEALLDFKVARGYYNQLLKLKKKLNLPGRIEIGHVVAYPDLLAGNNERLSETKIWPDLEKLITRAANDLYKMRVAEGRNLKRDINQRLKHAAGLVRSIEKQSPKNVTAYRQRLIKRIHEWSNGLELDPGRLAEEVTIYADRSDLTEECIRLRSHLDMFAATMKSDGETGKRLNFILQEMGREANTISSKALSGTTSTCAIELKEEIEKLREQIQNIE